MPSVRVVLRSFLTIEKKNVTRERSGAKQLLNLESIETRQTIIATRKIVSITHTQLSNLRPSTL